MGVDRERATSHRIEMRLAGSPRHCINNKAPSRAEKGLCTPAWFFSVRLVAYASAAHVASPGAGFLTAILDEFAKTLHITFKASLDHTQHVGGVLHEAFRIVFHAQRDARAIRIHLLERHGAGVLRPRRRTPGDLAIRNLLRDLGIPLAVHARDLGVPAKVRIVELLHFFYAFHELRERFELRPLVVDLGKRALYFHGFLYDGHALILS